jgi:hypothetical protein
VIVKRTAIGLALGALVTIVLLGGALPMSRVASAGETQVSGAATGIFPDGTSFNGIPLQGSTFGLGVVINPDGGAVGNFEIVLAGTSQLGQRQNITLEGQVNAGTANVDPNADSTATFSGTASLDLGDGSLPTSVPFTVMVTADGLQLTIGTTDLPTQTLTDGSIFIGE